MHSITFVLLRLPIVNLSRATIEALIHPYRLNEQDYDPSWRYDYWTVGYGHIADPETAAAVGLTGMPPRCSRSTRTAWRSRSTRTRSDA